MLTETSTPLNGMTQIFPSSSIQGLRDLEKGDSRLFNEECNCCVYVSAYQLITSNKVKYILKGLTQVL